MIRLIVTFLLLLPVSIVQAATCADAVKTDAPPALHRPVSGEITKPFGLVTHPLLMISRMHTGLDFRGATGDAVVSAAPGRVNAANTNGEFGHFVSVDHGSGWETIYAHLDRIDIKTGACVSAGERIGTRGSTGLSTGPHLHFEVHHDGRPVDPAPLLR